MATEETTATTTANRTMERNGTTSTTEVSEVTFATPVASDRPEDDSSHNLLNKNTTDLEKQKRPPMLNSKSLARSASAMRNVTVGASIRSSSERKRVVEEHRDNLSDQWWGWMCAVIFPWNKYYMSWWIMTVIAAVFTFFLETYEIAFDTRTYEDKADNTSILEYTLFAIFFVDILVTFNLAFYNQLDEIVYDRWMIAKNYLRGMFWIDLIGVFPFYIVGLAWAGLLRTPQSSMDEATITKVQYLSLLGLFRLFRWHRIIKLIEISKYSSKISLMTLTLVRNFSAALIWTHFSACVIYFISRLYGFHEEDTFIGGSIANLDAFEQYVTALYWSVVTFTTVGYGDYSPQNATEQIWGIIYMLLNMILASWIIGSMTLLIVKNDEKTGIYRETLKVLDHYSKLNNFDRELHKRLKMQLKLDFNNREIADEHVLSHFPSSVRRKVLRKLYLPSLIKTSLMKSIRQHFVDAFLDTCNVEIFGPGEEILTRGSVSSDLYLLVGGTVELCLVSNNVVDKNVDDEGGSVADYVSTADSALSAFGGGKGRQIEAGEFINEICFFTESPQIDTVRTTSVCKTLTMPLAAYKLIAQDHPGSAGKVLYNLLAKVEKIAAEIGSPPRASLPKKLQVLSAGSEFDPNDSSHRGGESEHATEVNHTVALIQTESALTAIQDLVKMHINKQNDDHTTRFLFAASRGDTETITLMCDQGFDSNSADYDNRTALMVAAMKGNTEVVTKLFSHQANPNLVDVHGSSALYEASRSGHETTMDVLIANHAELCMSESLAASTLCQAVFDGDILQLKRLLRAGIQVNASDYDKRTALHIAAAEGNVAAFKILVENGADWKLKDRWSNTVHDEATRANAGQLVEYLKTLETATST